MCRRLFVERIFLQRIKPRRVYRDKTAGGGMVVPASLHLKGVLRRIDYAVFRLLRNGINFKGETYQSFFLQNTVYCFIGNALRFRAFVFGTL